MTDPQDPPRLVDDPEASERVRDLLRECRSDVGTPDEVKRLESRLVPLIWAPPPATGGPGSTTAGSPAVASAASGTALKAITAVAVAVGLAGGGLWLSKSSTSRVTEGPAPSIAGDAKPAPMTGATAAEQPSPAREAPAAQSDESAAAPKARPPSSSKERSATTEEAASESESDLLGRAQAALRSDPARALSIAGDHRKKFPNGVLAQEREVLSIEALERLGRHAEAVARADRFLKSFPGSAHRSKVNAVIGR